MSSIMSKKTRRIIFYIDGFNFYFGLKANSWNSYYWLDYPKFAKNLSRKLENSEVVNTKYFTSRITSPSDKRIRQKDYLEVLEMRGNIDIYYGNYKENKYECTGCHRPNYIHNEKQTDVNIAVQMLVDAYQDHFDIAVLLGGDSDLVPPINAIKSLFPDKQVIACFPPNRFSKEIRAITNGQLHIHEPDLKNSQLPDQVTRGDGFIYKRPTKWK